MCGKMTRAHARPPASPTDRPVAKWQEKLSFLLIGHVIVNVCHVPYLLPMASDIFVYSIFSADVIKYSVQGAQSVTYSTPPSSRPHHVFSLGSMSIIRCRSLWNKRSDPVVLLLSFGAPYNNCNFDCVHSNSYSGTFLGIFLTLNWFNMCYILQDVMV